MPDKESLFGRLLSTAKQYPEKQALVSDIATLSYSELLDLILMQADYLAEKGVDNTSVVGICCAEDIPHLVLLLSSCFLGAASCTIPSYESNTVQDELIDRCGVDQRLTAKDFIGYRALDKNSKETAKLKSMKARNHVTSSLKLAQTARLYFFTSGTTGKAKIVIHLDEDIVAQAHRHIASINERFACLASVEHNFAKRHRLYCLGQGATNIVINSEQDILQQAEQLAVNVLHLSVFQAQQLLSQPNPQKLNNTRIKLGGSHASSELRKQLWEIANGLQAGYGTTETGAIAFTDPNDKQLAESVGRPLPGIHIRVVDANRKPVKDGERGEIAISCEGMFRGYLNQPDVTHRRLHQGWFYTGDLGYLKDNKIYLSGRADDMFVFNSINIYPQDIESVLAQFPSVEQVSVIPKKSVIHGDIPVALVVYKAHLSPDIKELKQFSDERLGIRSPKQFIVLEEIPRNSSGKVARAQVMAVLNKNENVRTEVVSTLFDGRANLHIKQPDISAFLSGENDIPLKQLAIDSLLTISLLVMIETKFGVVITPKELVELQTLNRLAAYILTAKERPDETYHHPVARCEVDTEFCSSALYKLFQRLLRCSSLVQLHKALSTLESRITPNEVEQLFLFYQQGKLFTSTSSDKVKRVVEKWLYELRDLMFDDVQLAPQVFQHKRIAPVVRLYSGHGSPSSKTLIIGFAPKKSRVIDVATPIILQHIPSEYYDVMIIAEPLGKSYKEGLPMLGVSRLAVIDWLKNHPCTQEYQSIRTFGCSAGAHIAVLAAYRLKAELGLSIGGRFHNEKHPLKIFKRLTSLIKMVRSKEPVQLILCHSIKGSRDNIYAKFVAWLSGGARYSVQNELGTCSHQVLNDVTDYQMLSQFFAETLLIDSQSEKVKQDRQLVLSKV